MKKNTQKKRQQKTARSMMAFSVLSAAVLSITTATAANLFNRDTNPPTTGGGLCDSSDLMAVPQNPAEAGPWTVGSKTVQIGNLTTEVFYPAAAGTEVGKELKQWDVRQFMPAGEAAKIPDEAAMKTCKTCYPDLPIDSTHGKYPVLIYVHGTAATRIYSLPFFEHWASRGFVVISADNPGITQKDIMESFRNLLKADQKGDTQKLIREVNTLSASSPLAFLRGHIDANRIGLSGHSAGGVAVNALGSESGVRVIIPMASGGTKEGSQIKSTLVLGGLEDNTATFSVTTRAYESSPKPRRLVGFAGMGHVGFVDVCRGAELRQQYGLEFSPAMNQLLSDGCGPQFLDVEKGWEMINYVSTATFEETLMCSDSSADSLKAFPSRYGSQNVYKEAL